MKKYKAKRGNGIKILILVALAIPAVDFFVPGSHWFILLPLFLPASLLIWAYFDTFYFMKNGFFHYKSAFLKGKIDVGRIREIHNNKTMWSGTKPALASNGLIIKYNLYEEVYIAPENNEELIEDLLTVNPQIKVI